MRAVTLYENELAAVLFEPVAAPRLLEGTSPLKLLGRYIPVRAEVVDCTTLSVHADQGEILEWLGSAAAEPDTAFVVHGEPDAANTLCKSIQKDLGWSCVVARHLERVQV